MAGKQRPGEHNNTGLLSRRPRRLAHFRIEDMYRVALFLAGTFLVLGTTTEAHARPRNRARQRYVWVEQTPRMTYRVVCNCQPVPANSVLTPVPAPNPPATESPAIPYAPPAPTSGASATGENAKEMPKAATPAEKATLAPAPAVDPATSPAEKSTAKEPPVEADASDAVEEVPAPDEETVEAVETPSKLDDDEPDEEMPAKGDDEEETESTGDEADEVESSEDAEGDEDGDGDAVEPADTEADE